MGFVLLNNNLSPLPFYDEESFQNHRKDYAFGNIYPLICPLRRVLPFQFIYKAGSQDITVGTPIITWLDEENSHISHEVPLNISWKALEVTDTTNTSIGFYKGDTDLPEINREGRAYIKIEINNTFIYSEIITFVSDISNYLRIDYKNSYPFTFGVYDNRQIIFKKVEQDDDFIVSVTNFMFRVYLCSQLGKPEYVFEESAVERMGYSFIESQVSKKIYKFNFLAPEFLCDALRIIRLCDYKKLYSKGITYNMLNFEMAVEWQEQGDIANVECSFEADTIIANIGGYTDVLDEDINNGNFNLDFNEDYNI